MQDDLVGVLRARDIDIHAAVKGEGRRVTRVDIRSEFKNVVVGLQEVWQAVVDDWWWRRRRGGRRRR